MKGMLKKVLCIMIAISLVAVTAIAVISNATWDDGTLTKTINKGENATFYADIYSIQPQISFIANVYDPNGDFVGYYEDTSSSGFIEFEGIIASDIITIGGIYTIDITSTDGNGETTTSTLYLNVLNKAPVITGISAPASINAGEVLSVSFAASDPDNDTLTYHIYRNKIGAGQITWINGNNDAWQTTASDVGVYTYRFEVTDGDDTVSQTRTIAVNAPGTPKAGAEISELLSLGKDIEISKVYNFLKIRSNEGRAIDNFEITVTYMGLGTFETYNFDIGRNDVVYKLLTTNLSKGTWLAKIDIKAKDVEDSGYLVIRK